MKDGGGAFVPHLFAAPRAPISATEAEKIWEDREFFGGSEGGTTMKDTLSLACIWGAGSREALHCCALHIITYEVGLRGWRVALRFGLFLFF